MQTTSILFFFCLISIYLFHTLQKWQRAINMLLTVVCVSLLCCLPGKAAEYLRKQKTRWKCSSNMHENICLRNRVLCPLIEPGIFSQNSIHGERNSIEVFGTHGQLACDYYEPAAVAISCRKLFAWFRQKLNICSEYRWTISSGNVCSPLSPCSCYSESSDSMFNFMRKFDRHLPHRPDVIKRGFDYMFC